MSVVIVMPVTRKDTDGKRLVQSRLSQEDFRRLQAIADAGWGGDVERCASDLLRFKINFIQLMRGGR